MKQNNSPESLLDEIEKIQNEGKAHWVWKKLGCRPDDFFQAVSRTIQSLSLSEEKLRYLREDALRDIQERANRKMIPTTNINFLQALKI